MQPNFIPLMDAVFDWFVLVSGMHPDKVVWSRGGSGNSPDRNTFRPERPFASLDFLSGPIPFGAYDEIRTGGVQTQQDRVQVLRVLDSTLYRVTLNGTDFDFVSGIGATADSIVLGLVGVINGGAQPVTAANGGGGYLALEGDVAGDLFSVAVGANLLVRGGRGAVEQIVTGPRTFVVSCQIYGTTREEAQALANAVQLGVSDPYVQAPLIDANLATLGIAGVVNVSELLETNYEPRFAIDVTFGMTAQKDVAGVTHIDTVDLSGGTLQPGG